MKDIPDKSIDMILCDLPYGATKYKWDRIIPLKPLWEQYNRIAKNEAAIVLFADYPFAAQLINSNFSNFRYAWYWKRNNVTGFLNAKKMPLRQIEQILVFMPHLNKKSNKTNFKYNPQGLVEIRRERKKCLCELHNFYSKEYVQTKTNYPKNLIEFDNEFGLHPTQKPVALLEYLIKTYTNEGDVVIDNCAGSGSTAIACINTNRKFEGIEVDEKYFNIARERIEKKESEKHEHETT